MKKSNTYKHLYRIPRGSSKDNIIPGCLVLEGGAFRGTYTAGVLDCMMVNDINLECTIGISAGALVGFQYVSGDIGRAARINLGYRHDKRYIGLTAFRKNHGVIGFDFLFNETKHIFPLNEYRFFNSDRRFICLATSLERCALFH